MSQIFSIRVMKYQLSVVHTNLPLKECNFPFVTSIFEVYLLNYMFLLC